jgi:hypothetical protein
MTAEHTESEIPDQTTIGEAKQTVPPELVAIIREVLEANDGYCMDVAEEREALTLALISALRVVLPDLNFDEPDAQDAT